jgi:hypothetical protein
MRHRRAVIALFALTAATATAATASPKLVYKIDRVTAAILHDRLVVTAEGAVNSGGWTLPRLHLDLAHAEAGSETIEFQATPPLANAVVIQALLPMTTTSVFPLPRAGVTQVTVVGETNRVSAPIQPPR